MATYTVESGRGKREPKGSMMEAVWAAEERRRCTYATLTEALESPEFATPGAIVRRDDGTIAAEQV